MSGPHRKVSRSLDSSSITSRSHLTQPENELKQKLNAIDSSIKISNKKINNETRELRQILYDLQRDLKVSKSVTHYVPSPIEEQETKQTKRVRRVTIASAPRDLEFQRAEGIPKRIGKTSAEDDPGVTQGASTKRRRKTSVPPIIRGKILVKDDDVFKEWELTGTFSNEKTSGVEDSGKELLRDNEVQCTIDKRNCEEQQIIKCEHKTDGNCWHFDDDSVQDGAQLQIPSSSYPGSGETSQAEPSSSSLDGQLDSGNTDNQNSKGISNIHAQKRTSTHENAKGCATGSMTSYLKEGKRSVSESETAYRETFKGRFVTHSLPSQMNDHVRGTLPPPDSEKRTRRITVAGPHPFGARRRLDIGHIPMTPFHSGSRRISVNSMYEDERKTSRSLGRGPTGGGLPLRKGNDEEEVYKCLLATPSRDIQRYRRTSKVSSLPPLKEERTVQNVEKQAALPSEWKNLENCRYLRKEDYEISIEDIFKKD